MLITHGKSKFYENKKIMKLEEKIIMKLNLPYFDRVNVSQKKIPVKAQKIILVLFVFFSSESILCPLPIGYQKGKLC